MPGGETPASAQRARGRGELREEFLMVVAERGPIRQADVAVALGVGQPVVSKLVNHRCDELLVVGPLVSRSPLLSIKPGVRLPDGSFPDELPEDEGDVDVVEGQGEDAVAHREGDGRGDQGPDDPRGAAPEPGDAGIAPARAPTVGGGGREHVEADAEPDKASAADGALSDVRLPEVVELWFEHLRNMIERARNEPECPEFVFEHIEKAMLSGPPGP
jgi:hypothetical protein